LVNGSDSGSGVLSGVSWITASPLAEACCCRVQTGYLRETDESAINCGCSRTTGALYDLSSMHLASILDHYDQQTEVDLTDYERFAVFISRVNSGIEGSKGQTTGRGFDVRFDNP